MKIDKQLRVLECLKSGRYKVTEDRVLRLSHGKYVELKPNLLPTGYKQVVVANHRRGEANISVRVYYHCLIYLGNKGVYPDGWEIDHVDSDKTNCHISNLEPKTHKDNVNNRMEKHPIDVYNTIRSAEIANIKQLMAVGLSQAEIARRLNLNRLSVRYTINNIKTGKKLKYE